MRDAFGGIVNLAMIVVFLVLVSGYLAFNVNYTKAFRVKNYVITSFEQYEGNCQANSACAKKISEYIKSIGYNAPDLKVSDYTCVSEGYCYHQFDATDETGVYSEGNKKIYFRIVTQINIDIPIINKILPSMKIFQVSGATKLITPFEE